MTVELVEGDPPSFSDHLEALKTNGSVLLVTGNPSRALTAVSAQLLGDPEKDRVPGFVLLDQDRTIVRERLGYGVDDSQVIQFGFPRSTTAQSGTASFPAGATEPSALLDVIEGLISSLEAGHDRAWGRGELRVCLDSLAPILDAYDRGQTEQFVAGFRDLVVARAAMAHCVLSVDPLPAGFEWLPPLFDVVIETREIAGVVQQRWRLTDAGLLTDWFGVELV